MNQRVAVFFAIMVLFLGSSWWSYQGKALNSNNLNNIAATLEKRIEKTPEDHNLYMLLGTIHYELKNWQKAKRAYEYSIGIKYNQPEALNNLAWLLLKTEDDLIRNPKKALKLASDAARLRQADFIMDTLAEAYYENEMYRQAYQAAQRALELSAANRSYFKKQVEKMKTAAEGREGDKKLF